jgi:Uma2 family endonuclease
MAFQEKVYTISEFQEWIARPENEGRFFELINGELIEVSPGRTRYSEIGHLLAVAVHRFCDDHKIPCHTSGGDGAYQIGQHIIAPDFAYKSTSMSEDYPDPEPPTLAVEIISPTDKVADIRAKRQIYRQAGILFWEMYPQSQNIDVYPPGKPVIELGIDDVLDGGDVLPGFTLAVKDLFK